MKKANVTQAIVWISIIIAIIGGGVFMSALNNDYDVNLFLSSFYLFIIAVFMYGFSYIVQAACVYLQNQAEEEYYDDVVEGQQRTT